MTWFDLHEDILSEFAERGSWAYGTEITRRREVQRRYYERVRCLPSVRGLELAQRRAKRAVIRERKLARRPCAHCAMPFERGGPIGTVPKYCSPRCMRAAIWARYSAKRRAA